MLFPYHGAPQNDIKILVFCALVKLLTRKPRTFQTKNCIQTAISRQMEGLRNREVWLLEQVQLLHNSKQVSEYYCKDRVTDNTTKHRSYILKWLRYLWCCLIIG